MKVANLIKLLQQLPSDIEICVSNHDYATSSRDPVLGAPFQARIVNFKYYPDENGECTLIQL